MLRFTIFSAVCLIAVQASKIESLKEQHKHEVNPYIAYGRPALPHMYPFQAAVYLNDKSAFCGGALISDEWVLTSATCIAGAENWEIILGAHVLSDENEDGRIALQSTEALIHENFDVSSLENDIGLIKLPKKVELSDAIQPVALPTRKRSEWDNEWGTLCLSGWGVDREGSRTLAEELMWTPIDGLDNYDCGIFFGEEIVKNGTICASGPAAAGACAGDGGGPLFVRTQNGMFLVGVISFITDRGCGNGGPTVCTRTGYYLDWISEKTDIVIKDE